MSFLIGVEAEVGGAVWEGRRGIEPGGRKKGRRRVRRDRLRDWRKPPRMKVIR